MQKFIDIKIKETEEMKLVWKETWSCQHGWQVWAQVEWFCCQDYLQSEPVQRRFGINFTSRKYHDSVIKEMLRKYLFEGNFAIVFVIFKKIELKFL